MYITHIHGRGSGIRGDKGEPLAMASNLPYKDGDPVWTDGRIIYGWTGRRQPTRQWGYVYSGIPLNCVEMGLYLFRDMDNIAQWGGYKDGVGFANNENFYCVSTNSKLYDLDIDNEGEKWELSFDDDSDDVSFAGYYLKTPHTLHTAQEQPAEWGGAVFFDAADSNNYATIDSETEISIPLKIYHGDKLADEMDFKEIADYMQRQWEREALRTYLSYNHSVKSYHFDNYVDTLYACLVDARTTPDGDYYYYIVACCDGYIFKDVYKEPSPTTFAVAGWEMQYTAHYLIHNGEISLLYDSHNDIFTSIVVNSREQPAMWRIVNSVVPSTKGKSGSFTIIDSAGAYFSPYYGAKTEMPIQDGYYALIDAHNTEDITFELTDVKAKEDSEELTGRIVSDNANLYMRCFQEVYQGAYYEREMVIDAGTGNYVRAILQLPTDSEDEKAYLINCTDNAMTPPSKLYYVTKDKQGAFTQRQVTTQEPQPLKPNNYRLREIRNAMMLM